MTPQQVAALQTIAAAIIEAVDAAGTIGAPSGPLYAALNARGCSLAQYEQITDGLERAGMLRRSGYLLHSTQKGRAFAARVK